MKQSISFITTSFGKIDIKVIFDTIFTNSIIIGKTRLHLDIILPKDINIKKEDFHINIYDGVHTNIEVILENIIYYGEFSLCNNSIDNTIWVEKPYILTTPKQN